MLVLDLGRRTGRARRVVEVGDARRSGATRRRGGRESVVEAAVDLGAPADAPALGERDARGCRARRDAPWWRYRATNSSSENGSSRVGSVPGPSSTTSTDRPASASGAAVTAPPAPEPMTRTSVSSVVMREPSTSRCSGSCSSSRRRSRATTAGAGTGGRRRSGCAPTRSMRPPDRARRSGSGRGAAARRAPRPIDSTATPRRRCSGIARERRVDEARDRDRRCVGHRRPARAATTRRSNQNMSGSIPTGPSTRCPTCGIATPARIRDAGATTRGGRGDEDRRLGADAEPLVAVGDQRRDHDADQRRRRAARPGPGAGRAGPSPAIANGYEDPLQPGAGPLPAERSALERLELDLLRGPEHAERAQEPGDARPSGRSPRWSRT